MVDLHSVSGLTPPLFVKLTPTGPRPKDRAPSRSPSPAGMELTLGDTLGPCELMHHSFRGCLDSSSAITLGPENTFSPLTATVPRTDVHRGGPRCQAAQLPDHSGPEGLAQPEDEVCSSECPFRRQGRKRVGRGGGGWQHQPRSSLQG